MAKAEAEAKKPEGMRSLTEAEIAEMHGDNMPPVDYANTVLNDQLETPPTKPEGTPESETPASEEEGAAEPETPAAPETPAKPETPATPPAAGTRKDFFERMEQDLIEAETKNVTDIKEFAKTKKDYTPRERAYFAEVWKNRKQRQKAEEERDVAVRKLHQANNPPPPPPDPFAGKAEDDVLSVKEVKELLAKQPKPEAPKPETPVVTPQQKRYLVLCEKEARDAHPEDFDAVMELADDLVSTDAMALREIGEGVANGGNPAELMYQAVKRHKDFETLLPAAQTRAKARGKAPAEPATPPASPSAPAAPPTPEDKAKLDKAHQAQQALENNGNRPKTTAHALGREGKPVEDLTFDEIYAMSDVEFAKLPRNVRQKYLKKFGV